MALPQRVFVGGSPPPPPAPAGSTPPSPAPVLWSQWPLQSSSPVTLQGDQPIPLLPLMYVQPHIPGQSGAPPSPVVSAGLLGDPGSRAASSGGSHSVQLHGLPVHYPRRHVRRLLRGCGVSDDAVAALAAWDSPNGPIWTVTLSSPAAAQRMLQLSPLLASGHRVVVTGGSGDVPPAAITGGSLTPTSGAVYDIATGQWVSAGRVDIPPPPGHARVLVGRRPSTATSEGGPSEADESERSFRGPGQLPSRPPSAIFDVATGQWGPTSPPEARHSASHARLLFGRRVSTATSEGLTSEPSGSDPLSRRSSAGPFDLTTAQWAAATAALAPAIPTTGLARSIAGLRRASIASSSAVHPEEDESGPSSRRSSSAVYDAEAQPARSSLQRLPGRQASALTSDPDDSARSSSGPSHEDKETSTDDLWVTGGFDVPYASPEASRATGRPPSAEEAAALVRALLRDRDITDPDDVPPSLLARIYTLLLLARPSPLLLIQPGNRFIAEFEKHAGSKRGTVSLGTAVLLLQPMAEDFGFRLPVGVATWVTGRINDCCPDPLAPVVTKATFVRIRNLIWASFQLTSLLRSWLAEEEAGPRAEPPRRRTSGGSSVPSSARSSGTIEELRRDPSPLRSAEDARFLVRSRLRTEGVGTAGDLPAAIVAEAHAAYARCLPTLLPAPPPSGPALVEFHAKSQSGPVSLADALYMLRPSFDETFDFPLPVPVARWLAGRIAALCPEPSDAALSADVFLQLRHVLWDAYHLAALLRADLEPDLGPFGDPHQSGSPSAPPPG